MQRAKLANCQGGEAFARKSGPMPFSHKLYPDLATVGMRHTPRAAPEGHQPLFLHRTYRGRGEVRKGEVRHEVFQLLV